MEISDFLKDQLYDFIESYYKSQGKDYDVVILTEEEKNNVSGAVGVVRRIIGESESKTDSLFAYIILKLNLKDFDPSDYQMDTGELSSIFIKVAEVFSRLTTEDRIKAAFLKLKFSSDPDEWSTDQLLTHEEIKEKS